VFYNCSYYGTGLITCSLLQDLLLSIKPLIFVIHCIDGNKRTPSLSTLLAFWTGADDIPPMGFEERMKIDFYTREVLI
jgi:hypothetical protein